MTNVLDYWPTGTPPENSPEVWMDLIDRRSATFAGFAAKEAEHGFIQPKVSISTSKGQEILRLLSFRILEEMAESYDSVELDHQLEELIDAFNYLLSMFLLGKTIDHELHIKLANLAQDDSFNTASHRKPHLHEIGAATVILGVNLGDLLRNRAWMTNAQNTYFDGDLFQILNPLILMIFGYFPNFETFWGYYVAKDNVLQFRLKSNY